MFVIVIIIIIFLIYDLTFKSHNHWNILSDIQSIRHKILTKIEYYLDLLLQYIGIYDDKLLIAFNASEYSKYTKQ